MIKGIEEAIKKISEYNPDEDYVQACKIIKSFVADAETIKQENTAMRNGLKVLKRSITLKPSVYYYTSFEIYNDIWDIAHIKEMMEVVDNE